MPASALQLAGGVDASCVQQLLQECQQQRPAVWQLLLAAIGKGVRARYRSDNDGPDTGGSSFD